MPSGQKDWGRSWLNSPTCLKERSERVGCRNLQLSIFRHGTTDETYSHFSSRLQLLTDRVIVAGFRLSKFRGFVFYPFKISIDRRYLLERGMLHQTVKIRVRRSKVEQGNSSVKILDKQEEFLGAEKGVPLEFRQKSGLLSL